MKIIITALTYYPNKDGVQMVTQYMAEGLVKLGHEVTVLTCLRDGYQREEEHNGVRIRRFIIKRFLKYSYGEKKEFQQYLLDHVQETDALITVCSNAAVAAWTYPIVEKLPCSKVMYQHGMYDGHLHLNQIHSFVRLVKQLLLTPYWEMYHRRHWKQIMKYDACIHIFEEDSSHRYFQKHGFTNNVVIMNSCEQALFEPMGDMAKDVVESYNIKQPYFLYVANFCSGKDQKLALRIFYELKLPEVELVLIGSEKNSYFEEMQELQKQLEADNPQHGQVHMLVGISREDTIALIQESYTIFMSSNNEFLPITIIEGMACGKPFISTNVGVVSKLPGGVIASEPEDLTYWMKYFMEHEEMVKQMGQIARQYVRENMYLEDKVKQLEEVLGGGE
jgi:glycosyltransferase involved in cell wall biosynthesis